MVVMTPGEKWTDERLDDLNKKVDDGFARVQSDIEGVRRELNHQATGLRTEMNSRFDALNARFDAQNRTLIAGFFVGAAAIIGSNAF